MYEYRCTKCKKEYSHFLQLVHPCEKCGGKLKYLYKPVKGITKLEDIATINSRIPQSTEFVPVRAFGGYGKVLYYRRKNKLTAKKEIDKKL